jgi:hypothetical protein
VYKLRPLFFLWFPCCANLSSSPNCAIWLHVQSCRHHPCVLWLLKFNWLTRLAQDYLGHKKMLLFSTWFTDITQVCTILWTLQAHKVACNMSHSCIKTNSDLERLGLVCRTEGASFLCVCVCVCIDHFLVSWLSSKPVEEDDAYTNNRSWDLFVPIFKSWAKSFKHILFSIGSDQSTAFCFFCLPPKSCFSLLHDMTPPPTKFSRMNSQTLSYLVFNKVSSTLNNNNNISSFADRAVCLINSWNFECIHQSSCSAGLTVDQIAISITCITSCGQSMFLAHVLYPSNLLSTFLWL